MQYDGESSVSIYQHHVSLYLAHWTETHSYRVEQENPQLFGVIPHPFQTETLGQCPSSQTTFRERKKNLMTFGAQAQLWLWLNCEAHQTVTTPSATSYVHHRRPDSQVRADSPVTARGFLFKIRCYVVNSTHWKLLKCLYSLCWLKTTNISLTVPYRQIYKTNIIGQVEIYCHFIVIY